MPDQNKDEPIEIVEEVAEANSDDLVEAMIVADLIETQEAPIVADLIEDKIVAELVEDKIVAELVEEDCENPSFQLTLKTMFLVMIAACLVIGLTTQLKMLGLLSICSLLTLGMAAYDYMKTVRAESDQRPLDLGIAHCKCSLDIAYAFMVYLLISAIADKYLSSLERYSRPRDESFIYLFAQIVFFISITVIYLCVRYTEFTFFIAKIFISRIYYLSNKKLSKRKWNDVGYRSLWILPFYVSIFGILLILYQLSTAYSHHPEVDYITVDHWFFYWMIGALLWASSLIFLFYFFNQWRKAAKNLKKAS